MMTMLDQLLVVSRAKYDHQRQAFAKILAEESRLRQEIARLDDLNKSAVQRETDITEMRAIGADLLWQGWLSRSKTTLNMELARVLATKTHEQEIVRQAFGKVAALQELIADERKVRKCKQAQTTLANIIDQSLH